MTITRIQSDRPSSQSAPGLTLIMYGTSNGKIRCQDDKKLELCQAENLNKFDTVNEALGDITDRITIMESEQKRCTRSTVRRY